jgi:hypothetical protein
MIFRAEVFDMHGPEEVLVHVPHISATVAGSILGSSSRRL